MWSNRRGEKIVRRTIDGSDPGAPAVQRMFAEAESAARRLTFAARQQRADQDVSARSEQIETSGGTVDARFVTNNGQETLILTAYPKGAKSPGGGGRVRVQKIFEVDRSLIEGDVPQEAIDAAARSIFKEIVLIGEEMLQEKDVGPRRGATGAGGYEVSIIPGGPNLVLVRHVAIPRLKKGDGPPDPPPPPPGGRTRYWIYTQVDHAEFYSGGINGTYTPTMYLLATKLAATEDPSDMSHIYYVYGVDPFVSYPIGWNGMPGYIFSWGKDFLTGVDVHKVPSYSPIYWRAFSEAEFGRLQFVYRDSSYNGYGYRHPEPPPGGVPVASTVTAYRTGP